jgi:hypothetical protein
MCARIQFVLRVVDVCTAVYVDESSGLPPIGPLDGGKTWFGYVTRPGRFLFFGTSSPPRPGSCTRSLF